MFGTNHQLWHALVVGQNHTHRDLKRFASECPEQVLTGFAQIEHRLSTQERLALQPIIRRAHQAQQELRH